MRFKLFQVEGLGYLTFIQQTMEIYTHFSQVEAFTNKPEEQVYLLILHKRHAIGIQLHQKTTIFMP